MTGTTFTGVLHLEQNLNAVNPSYGRVNFVTVSKSFSYPLPKICLIKPPKFNTSTSKALRVFKTRQVPRRAISTADSQTSGITKEFFFRLNEDLSVHHMFITSQMAPINSLILMNFKQPLVLLKRLANFACW